MANTIQHNADFLFIYEASQCNPNGDPDQENKPRMDYDTNTNLVTDVRVKRYIRDFLKTQDMDIFVDMESEAKVGMDNRLRGVLTRLFADDEQVKILLDDEEMFQRYLDIKVDKPEETVVKFVSKKPVDRALNRALLMGLVKQQFIDVRMFGSAFAVDGFNKAMTGPIQLNWGYSLNQVYLLDSDTIASIMADENSTFGKDYRVKYSLLAFHGAINKHAARTTGLTEEDVKLFREAVWSSISALPTRSKLNQYPKLYVEVVYHEGFHNGYFGDLRNLVKVGYANGIEPRAVQRYGDLEVDFSLLKQALESAEAKAGKPVVKEIHVQTAPDVAY